jgi:hypothetical protein
MNTYVIIGAPGQGKSEFTKQAVAPTDGSLKRCWVFDVQNEYGPRTKYRGQKPLLLSDNPNAERARYVPKSMRIREDAQKFMEQAFHKRDTNVIFEEATIFLEGRMGDMVKTLIVGRLHTGNAYYFIFHSINSVPPRIMEMANYVVLYKTNDRDYIVQYKYPRLFQHFLDLQPMPNGSSKIIKIM